MESINESNESNQSAIFETTPPVLPVAPYLGGKSRLAKSLIPIIMNTPHKTYAEPFVGMGGVFFRRPYRAKAEVINDLNLDIYNLFRVISEHYAYFINYMKYQLTFKKEFERLNKIDPATLTDIQRAARFLYLQRTGFGGKVNSNSFGVSKDRPARFDISKLAPMLEELHERLAGVVLQCLAYDQFIDKYDAPETLFYLDPPYFNSENDYGKDMFSRDDFAKMAKQLKSIKAKFILSINDLPEIRKIFDGFHMQEVQLNYSIAKNNATKARELIITN